MIMIKNPERNHDDSLPLSISILKCSMVRSMKKLNEEMDGNSALLWLIIVQRFFGSLKQRNKILKLRILSMSILLS